jgi:hypothetical protein
MTPRIAVGGLMFEENARWSLSLHEGIIVGMRVKDSGILRIRQVERNLLSFQLDNENCLKAACHLLCVKPCQVSEREIHQTPCGPFGAGTFVGKSDVQRVWYTTRPSGLIVGIYSCPTEFAGDALYHMICSECAHLLATAIYDRPSWGADDPLTRILIEGIEAFERARGGKGEGRAFDQ